MARPTETRKGDRLLLKEGGNLYEAVVWEVSPSGNYTLLLMKDSKRLWLPSQEVLSLALEVLA